MNATALLKVWSALLGPPFSATFIVKKSLPMSQLWSIIASSYDPIKDVK
jgi:hypothetical protein